MEPTSTQARRFREAIEPIHAAGYFAPEPAEAVGGIWLRGCWMGYCASRAPAARQPREHPRAASTAPVSL